MSFWQLDLLNIVLLNKMGQTNSVVFMGVVNQSHFLLNWMKGEGVVNAFDDQWN